MTTAPEEQLAAIIDRARRDAGTDDPEQVWRALLASRPSALTTDLWKELWRAAGQGRAGDQTASAAMWFPDDDALGQSQLARWMHARGDRDFESFRRWSLMNRGEFWQDAVQRLGIVFDRPPDSPLIDDSGGANPRWFPGARMNIVWSCFGGPAMSTAIVSQRPGSPLQKVTLGELRCEVDRIVGAIRAAGCQPGDALGVVLPLTPLTVAIYLGIIAAGCRVVSIADSFAPPEIGSRLRIGNARAVFTCDVQVRGGKTLPLGQRVQQATELPAIVIADAGGSPCLGLRPADRSWDDFLSAGQPDSAWYSADRMEIINVLFSSGTTGDPKAIPWTHLTPLKCAVDGLVHQDIRPGHVCCWPTSLGWMMGPWLIFATLINRGTIALYEDAPMGAGFGQFVQDAGVNMLGVVPTIVRAWRESRAMEQFDWHGIHCFSSTGESSRADDMFYLSSLAGMRPVIEYCGGTEIGGGYISSTMVQPNVPAAFSTPAAGLDFVILDEACQPADEGELFLVPPCVGLSQTLLNRDHEATYFADTPACPPSGTASGVAPLASTRLRRHGDHFRRLPGGYFAAGGRVDDTMNLGGIKTSSAELERVLNQVSGIRETAAVAWSESGGPEELHVFFVASGDPLPDDLLHAMNTRLKTDLNPLFRVRAVHPVDSLPRTASNKVMRRLLRDRLTGSRDQKAGP